MPPSPEVTIRRIGGAQEQEACARLMARSEPWLTLRRDAAGLRRVLADGTKEVYVAVVGEAVAGLIVIDMQGACSGYIQAVCVVPRWRGQGVGGVLLDFAEARIFREKPNVFLCVSSFNQGARRFYLRRGYEEVGVLKDYIVAGYDEILLRKSIAPWDAFEPRSAA